MKPLKVKYYPLRRNGEIARTPTYFDSVNADFLISICGDNNIDRTELQWAFRYKDFPLYQTARKVVLSDGLDVENQIQVSPNRFLTTEELKMLLTQCVLGQIRDRISDTLLSLRNWQTSAEKKFKEKHDDLDYVACEMEKDVLEYKIRKAKIDALCRGDIYCKNPNVDPDDRRYDSFLEIIPDARIVPFTTLLKDICLA